MREPWYLDEVKPKTNKEWTEAEKLNVFVESKYRNSSEVAHMFGLSLYQVYNNNRLVNKGLKHKCYICGDLLTDEEDKASNSLVKACTKCKKSSSKYKKSYRRKAKRKHLCIYCGTNPVIPGYVSCKYCVSATHRRRYKLGLCGMCGEKPIAREGGALCTKCAKELKLKARKKRHALC